MKLQLSIGMADNPRTRAIFDGRVTPDGIDLIPTALHASELFWRQLRFGDFDVSEMSMSSLMMAVAGGDDRWVGIPVFTTRRMFHVGVLVRKDSGIDKPADLKGKKMGVPEYQQTAALWTRGYLQHEYDVHPRDMEFWMERNDDTSQGAATGFRPPADVKVNYIPNSTNMGEMLLEGKLHGALRYLAGTNNLVDRSSVDLYRHPDFKTLFPDMHAEGVKSYQKTGIYPINHGMVIKREIAEKHPWVILNLFKAFQKANDIAEKARKEAVEYHLETGLLPPEARKALATPIIQHGIIANRKVLETTAQYSFEQGLTPRLIKLEELFAPSTMEF
ncbi:MAG TPA: PhnD/SsuA/transferrin family substrate-binding protein [Alphaproteobacteria bacterium]|jgi:4,5-dihydroxyphthalate decarboxylase